MIANIRTWLVVTFLGLACAGAAAVVYGPEIARNVLPQFFLARAAAVTAQEFRPALMAAHSMIPRIQREPLRHELILGLNSINTAGGLDPSLQAVLPILSMRNVTRWDNVNNAFAANLNLQMAATTIIGADLHLDSDRILLNVPMLLEHGIIVNPRQLGSEWNQSILGGLLFPVIIDDQVFYQIYQDILFSRMEEVDFSPFLDSLPRLILETEIEFLGREAFEGSGRQVEVFEVTVPAERANNSWELLLDTAVFQAPALDDTNIFTFINPLTTEDLIVTVYVDGGRLAGVDMIAETADFIQNASFRFPDVGSVSFNLLSVGKVSGFEQNLKGSMSVRETVGHHAINFTIEVSSHTGLSNNLDFSGDIFNQTITAHGDVRLFPEVWRVEADIRALSISLPELDVSLNARYMLFADTEPVLFFGDDARLLTDLNIFDLLGIYARIEGSPLAGILGNIMP